MRNRDGGLIQPVSIDVRFHSDIVDALRRRVGLPAVRYASPIYRESSARFLQSYFEWVDLFRAAFRAADGSRIASPGHRIELIFL